MHLHNLAFDKWKCCPPFKLIAADALHCVQVALVVLANQGCIIWGFVGNLFPTHYALACFTMSCLCMYYVLAKLHVMMLGTIGKDDKEARSRCGGDERTDYEDRHLYITSSDCRGFAWNHDPLLLRQTGCVPVLGWS